MTNKLFVIILLLLTNYLFSTNTVSNNDLPDGLESDVVRIVVELNKVLGTNYDYSIKKGLAPRTKWDLIEDDLLKKHPNIIKKENNTITIKLNDGNSKTLISKLNPKIETDRIAYSLHKVNIDNNYLGFGIGYYDSGSYMFINLNNGNETHLDNINLVNGINEKFIIEQDVNYRSMDDTDYIFKLNIYSFNNGEIYKISTLTLGEYIIYGVTIKDSVITFYYSLYV